MITSQRVPMMDLGYQHALIADRVREGFDRVLETTAFIHGPDVTRFEEEFAAYCGATHVIGVGNGTDALELSLRAAGIGPGDEVIVPANTFVATAEAVLRAGAELVLVDCDDRFLIDPAKVAEAITPRTRAVAAVHLYGQAAPVELLREIVGPETLILEDAAQAQGATRFGRRAGSLGDIAATSFYPGKNLGAYGDGGGVITSSDELALAVRRLANHGGTERYEHLVVGTNSRLDTLQAVVLSAKLEHLDSWNQERSRLADSYRALLGHDERVTLPEVLLGNEHVYHQFVVRVADRDRVVADLNGQGIGVGIHYPLPVHRLPAFAGTEAARGSFPVAEETAGRLVSLPIFPGLTESQQGRVAEALLACL